MIKIKQATKQGFAYCLNGGVSDLSFPTSQTRRGRVQEHGNVSPTLCTENEVMKVDVSHNGYAIRKLTTKECWRLMDFKDDDFEKAAQVNSNTQLYKEAGNSIVVNVLVAIMGQLFKGHENDYKEFKE